jgi:hypothetical protein
VSCSRTFKNLGQATHCGECFQCIDRRIATHAAALQDFDQRGLYANDIVTQGISDREARTVAVDYLKQAIYFAEISEDHLHDDNLDALSDIVEYLPIGDSELDRVHMVWQLLNRHGNEVLLGLQQMRMLHEDLRRRLPRNCLLSIVADREYLRSDGADVVPGEAGQQGSLQAPSTGEEQKTGGKKTPEPIFICYAHQDNVGSNTSQGWLDRLLDHLEPLRAQKLISTWSDKQLEIGDDWDTSIRRRLQEARVAVLLVSPSFLASKYIRNSELPVLLKKHKEEGRFEVLPIIVRPCLFSEAKFKFPDPQYGPEEFTLASLQAAASPTRTLIEMEEGEQERVLLSVAQRMLQLVKSNH